MSIEVHVRVRPGVANSAWTAADTVLCSTARQDHRFPFGRVYNTSSTNNTVFTAVDPLIHAAFDGKNVTIMAYGQTGSGKTHSMVGTAADSGVMRRTAEVLANLRASYPGTTVSASCIEIYNETVSDLLLDPKERKPIEIRGDGVNTTYEKTLVPITCLQDFVSLHASAERYRRYGVTDLNGHSSRSHIILAFHIRRPTRAEGSVINLVDLAGSESAGKANTAGDTLREGGFINKSLLALGNVVSDIVAKRSHVGFRGSSLTRLLSPCLSGDGYTFILCCINPGVENYDQTVNALQFSQRAMKIKKDPTVTLTNMAPLFAFSLFRSLQQRQAHVAGMHTAAYQSGLYETYSTVQSSVLGAISDKEGKAIADAQAEAFSLQAQLIARDHLASVTHLKRQREVLDGHAARRAAAAAQLAEKARGDRDMVARVDEMRSKKMRAEADYSALLEDSAEAKAQWMGALEDAACLESERAVAALLAAEAHQRAAIEAQRPLFLEQLAEAMMAVSFPEREDVMRALGAIAAPHPTADSGDAASSSSSARAQTIAAKLTVYKGQLQQQWADLSAAASDLKEMMAEGEAFGGADDGASSINPDLFGLSEAEALDRLRALEEEVGDLQQRHEASSAAASLQRRQQSRSATPPPLPTARHGAVMVARRASPSSSAASASASAVPKYVVEKEGSPSSAGALRYSAYASATAGSMARLKGAVSAIADAKGRMGGGTTTASAAASSSSSSFLRARQYSDSTLISSPPEVPLRRPSTVPTTRPPPSKASPSSLRPPPSSFGTAQSPNVARPTRASAAKLSGTWGAGDRYEDPMGASTMMGQSSSSAPTSEIGIAARRRAEGVIRGRSRV